MQLRFKEVKCGKNKVKQTAYTRGRHGPRQTAAHLNMFQVFLCILIFILPLSFIIVCDFVPIILCAEQVSYADRCLTWSHFTALRRAVSGQWSVTLVLTVFGPFCRRQASLLLPAHNSLRGCTSQSGATVGLSETCSWF